MNSSLQGSKQSHWLYIALLFIIAVLAYWQISFLKYSVTHDMINCWIPWRYYISNCFENHTFPFWNPYQQLGYPIHADLQGPTWYPESILLSMTIGQDNITVQLLFIFYVFIAGMGMYFLSLAFQNNRTIAFIIGISYMLGGFFVAHVQHFYSIIGAAWLPFIILNYYKMHVEKSYIRALYAAIFMFLNLTGGNHTFSIILFYLFLTLLGYFIYQSIKEKHKEEIKKYILLNFVFGISTLLMISVVIVAFLQTAPYVERLNGLSYHNASIFKFSIQSLLTLLIPFSTANSGSVFDTDPSMSNMYFGIYIFIFVIAAVFSKKNLFEKTLLTFAFFCLFASFGPDTFFHRLIFNTLPFINLFRNPSYFNLFSIIISLIFASKHLSQFDINNSEFQKKTKLISIVFIGFLMVLIIYSFIKNDSQSFFFLNNFDSMFEFIKNSSFYQNIIFQGSIQLIFLCVFIFFIAKRKLNLKIVTFLVILNMVVSVQLNLAIVGYSTASPKELKEYLTTLPKNFPIPDTTKILYNTEEMGQKHGLYRNTSIFHKRIGADVFNSYCFSNYAMLKDSLPALYKNMLNNELFYFSDNIVSESQVWKMNSDEFKTNTIVLGKNEFQAAKQFIEKIPDSTNSSNYKIESFNPNKIELTVDNNKNQLLTLLQSNYTGWEVEIDGQKTELLLSNFLTMSVAAPKGIHKITFSYNNPKIIIAAIISYSTFLLILLFLNVYWIKKYGMEAKILFAFLCCLIILYIFFS